MPNWTLRVNKQNIATPHTPERPNEDVQANTADDVQRERDHRDDDDYRREDDDYRREDDDYGQQPQGHTSLLF